MKDYLFVIGLILSAIGIFGAIVAVIFEFQNPPIMQMKIALVGVSMVVLHLVLLVVRDTVKGE